MGAARFCFVVGGIKMDDLEWTFRDSYRKGFGEAIDWLVHLSQNPSLSLEDVGGILFDFCREDLAQQLEINDLMQVN